MINEKISLNPKIGYFTRQIVSWLKTWLKVKNPMRYLSGTSKLMIRFSRD